MISKLELNTLYANLHFGNEFFRSGSRNHNIPSSWFDETFSNANIKERKQGIVIAVDIQESNLPEEFFLYKNKSLLPNWNLNKWST